MSVRLGMVAKALLIYSLCSATALQPQEQGSAASIQISGMPSSNNTATAAATTSGAMLVQEQSSAPSIHGVHRLVREQKSVASIHSSGRIELLEKSGKAQDGRDKPQDATTEEIPGFRDIEDDTIIVKDHICGGGAKELERFAGPSARRLVECRQACMDNPDCMYYAFWPYSIGGKNLDGMCRNMCRLYNVCDSHSNDHEAIDPTNCTVSVFQMGATTQSDRPDWVKAIRNGSPKAANLVILPVLLLVEALIAFTA